MTKSDQARQYLATKIPIGLMREASYAAGRNHAYIQQYITRGKPHWLPEPVRAALVAWNSEIDPRRLKPPRGAAIRPRAPKREGDLIRLNSPTRAKIAYDGETLALLAAWERIREPDRRLTALSIMAALADDESMPRLQGVA